MAVAVVQRASQTRTDQHNVAVTFGSTPTVGNILFFWASSSGSATLTPPTGPTLVASAEAGTYAYGRLYSRVVQSGDGTSWAFSVNTGWVSANGIELSGANTSSPYDGGTTPTVTGPSSLGTISITPATSGGWALSFVAPDEGDHTSHASAGWTTTWAQGDSDVFHPSGMADTGTYTTGSALSNTWTVNSNDAGGAETIFLVVPGGGGSFTGTATTNTTTSSTSASGRSSGAASDTTASTTSASGSTGLSQSATTRVTTSSTSATGSAIDQATGQTTTSSTSAAGTVTVGFAGSASQTTNSTTSATAGTLGVFGSASAATTSSTSAVSTTLDTASLASTSSTSATGTVTTGFTGTASQVTASTTSAASKALDQASLTVTASTTAAGSVSIGPNQPASLTVTSTTSASGNVATFASASLTTVSVTSSVLQSVKFLYSPPTDNIRHLNPFGGVASLYGVPTPHVAWRTAGVWHSKAVAGIGDLDGADIVINCPTVVDSATALELEAAGIGTISPA